MVMTLSSFRAPSDALLLTMAHERMRGRPAHVIAAEFDPPVHPSDLSRWVNGRRQPTLAQAHQLAELLGRSVDELFPTLTEDDEPLGESGSSRKDRGSGRDGS